MDAISLYLEKYSVAAPRERVVKKAVAAAFKGALGIVVDDAVITVSGTVAHLSVHPAIKTELALKRGEFDAVLAQELGKMEACVI